MKLKKLLALILAVIICAGVFTGIPTVTPTVSAAGESLWENFYSDADGGFRADIPEGDTAAPTGYERIGVTKDSKSTQVTKEKYDLTETTFVLRDLYFTQQGSDWVNIVFANDQTTGKRQTQTDAANGTLSMFVRKRDTGIQFSVYKSGGGEITLLEADAADEYEIGFVKVYTSGLECRWVLRINNTYTYDSKSDIYSIVNTFGQNSTGSYISISANGNMVSFRASCKFFKNDDTNSRWVSRSRKLYNSDGTTATDNAVTLLRAKTNGTISSLSRYDMVENVFTISNAEVSTDFYTNNAYRTTFSFSKYREENNNVTSYNSMSSADKIQIFIRPKVEEVNGVKNTTHLIVTLSTSMKEDVFVPAAKDYKFSFVFEDGKYQMYINETRITNPDSKTSYIKTFNNAVNDFCTTGSGANCYIVVSSNTYFSGDYRVSIKPELVDDSLWKTFYKRADGGVRAEIPADDTTPPEGYERIGVTSNVKTALVTKEKYDLTETTVVLKYVNIGSTDSANRGILVFANTATIDTYSKSSEGRLSVLVRDTGKGIKFSIYNDSGSETGLGTIPYADEYEIGFVKFWSSNGYYIYRIRLNNNSYTIDEVTKFFEKSTGSYIGISSNVDFVASCKLLNNDNTHSRWVTTKEKLLDENGSATTDIADTTIRVNQNSLFTSLSRYNMLEDTFVISNSKLYTKTGDNTTNSRITIAIAANREANLATTNSNKCMSSETKIKFVIKQYKQDIDGDGVEEMTHLQVSLSTNIEANVLVPVANEYRFRFRKVGDNYRLFINDVQVGNDGSTIGYVKTFASAVKKFCTTGNAEKCYITLMAEDSAYWAGDFKVIKNSEFIANLEDAMYRCLDFEDFKIENGAVINGITYNSGDTFATAGDHEIIYPENDIRIKRTLALYRMGDLNTDNTTNILDFIAMNKHFSGNELSVSGQKAADLTQDKKVQADDLVALRKKLLGVDDFSDTTTDTAGSINAVFPKNNQTVKIANDNVYYWYQNFVSRSSAPYYGLGDIFAGEPVEFKWTDESNASSYVLKISASKDFETAIIVETTTNSATVSTLFAGTTYYWQVKAICDDGEVISNVYSFKTAVSPRTISIEGLSNSRDLDGYMTESGKRVKQGMIYRSANLNSVTADGKNTAINIYKIKTDLDLRNSGEEGAGSASPLGINYINAPGAYYTGGDHGIDLEKNREKLVKEIQTFADANNYPILVHCAVGRDRTGTISMLINGLLGVSKEDLFMDYELSFFSEKGSGDDPGIDHMVNQFEKMYNWIATEYGDADSSFSECVEKFMLDIGVSQTEINNIREIMLEQ